ARCDAATHRKDGGRRADAEREDEERADCETWRRHEGPNGVAQINEDTVERERTRRTRRWKRTPVSLPQRTQKRREARAAELGQGDARRLVRPVPAREELTPAIVEMLRQLLDDLGLARRRDRERRQACADAQGPVRHVPLPRRGARPRRSCPTSRAVARAPGGRAASGDRSGAGARRASRPTRL